MGALGFLSPAGILQWTAEALEGDARGRGSPEPDEDESPVIALSDQDGIPSLPSAPSGGNVREGADGGAGPSSCPAGGDALERADGCLSARAKSTIAPPSCSVHPSTDVTTMRRASFVAFLAAVGAALSLPFLLNTNMPEGGVHFKHSAAYPPNKRRMLLSYTNAIAQFFDPKSVELRPSIADGGHLSRRTNCQVVYVLGVEGSIHHGFMPVIRKLGERQIEFSIGTQYHVVKGHDALRTAIFGEAGLRERSPPMTDPDLVWSTVDAMCPPPHESWRKHVIIEGNSFPSGGPENDALQFRVRRQRSWIGMTPEEIASDERALNHPTNLYAFYDAYSPHVDVRFVVLHRPYLETIASHRDFDSGPKNHSNVIMGYLILLSRFLTGHAYSEDALNGSNARTPLWTIVCADKLSSRQYKTEGQLLEARERVLGYLAGFLGWPQHSCPRCFEEWKESGKSSPEERLGQDMTDTLLGHAERMEGMWPPRRREDNLPEQQCRM